MKHRDAPAFDTGTDSGMHLTVHPIDCHLCGDRFKGTRAEARAARWEPYSTQSQRALDHGPMVCPDCVMRVLDELLHALRDPRVLARHTQTGTTRKATENR